MPGARPSAGSEARAGADPPVPAPHLHMGTRLHGFRAAEPLICGCTSADDEEINVFRARRLSAGHLIPAHRPVCEMVVAR